MKLRTGKKGKKAGSPATWGWRRYKILYICLIASALLHFFLIFSVGPWWLSRAPRVRPRKMAVVSLKIKPRAAPPRPPVRAPAAPRVRPPEKKPPVPKPIYTDEEVRRDLAKVRSEELPRKFSRPKRERVRDVVRRKREEAKTWARKESDELEERIEREAAGEVGYRRVINLTGSSDYQIGRLMEQFEMGMEYGRRKFSDFNIPFTSSWLFTPGQIRGFASRHSRRDYRRITAWIPGDKKRIALQESGEGPPRAYIEPSVDAMAAIIVAEEEYFKTSGIEPEQLEALVFEPVWTYRGPAFKVVKAEKKKDKKKGG